jgi:RNA polymerase sigma factor (sigma-70 family)
MTDRELLARYVREGSQEAFAEIVGRHRDMVYSTCLRILGNREDAEDAAQATFMVLVRKAARLSGDEPLAGWLYRSAEFAARNARKIRFRRRRRELEARTMDAKKTRKKDDLWQETRPVLDAVLASLPARQRDAVVMRYLYGMSGSEVAAEMRRPRGTVTSWITRGLEGLRRGLRRRGVVMTSAALTGLLAGSTAEAAAPAGLTAAIQVACFGGSTVPANAVAITEATIKTMMWAKLKGLAVAAASLCVLAAAGTGAYVFQGARSSPVQNEVRTTRPASASVPTRFPSAREPADCPVGVGLTGLNFYTPEMVFVDLFKQSSRWIPQKVSSGPFDTKETLDLTDDGWIASLAPGQAAASLMCRNIGGRYPGGNYACLYEGEGAVSLAGDAKAVEGIPGRVKCRVDPSAEGIILRVTETDPNDPVRGIRFVPAGFEVDVDERPFRDAFLKRWSPLAILRFSDWQCTTSSAEHTWAARTTLAHQSQVRAQGVALEHMIELANAADADPWFSMPHDADDRYVRQFAAMVHDRLSPGLRVYVEYSDEVWNFALPQAAYALQLGREQGLGPGDAEAVYEYYARRSVQIFRIWEEAFGSADRLVRVLGVQCANAWMAGIVLDFEDAHAHADAVGVAPYFGDRAIHNSHVPPICSGVPGSVLSTSRQ